MENINLIMNNPNNCFYGHGTNSDDNKRIESIFINGLRCSHDSMYFTTCTLGQGNQMGKDVEELIMNWPHLSAKKIVIVSLPIKFHIIGAGPSFNHQYSAFYYTPDEAQREKYNLTNSNYVMPEFILGCFDVEKDLFIENEKYYERLTNEEQMNIFNKVVNNYINIIEDTWGLEEYKEVISELPGWEFPLTDEQYNSLFNKDNYKKH